MTDALLKFVAKTTNTFPTASVVVTMALFLVILAMILSLRSIERRTKMPCPNCNGTGTVPRKDLP